MEITERRALLLRAAPSIRRGAQENGLPARSLDAGHGRSASVNRADLLGEPLVLLDAATGPLVAPRREAAAGNP